MSCRFCKAYDCGPDYRFYLGSMGFWHTTTIGCSGHMLAKDAALLESCTSVRGKIQFACETGDVARLLLGVVEAWRYAELLLEIPAPREDVLGARTSVRDRRCSRPHVEHAPACPHGYLR